MYAGAIATKVEATKAYGAQVDLAAVDAAVDAFARLDRHLAESERTSCCRSTTRSCWRARAR